MTEAERLRAWNEKLHAMALGMTMLAVPSLLSKGDWPAAAFVTLIAVGLWRMTFPRGDHLKEQGE